MAKILVTGATGFIGKRLVYKLLEEGHEVYALTRIKGVGANILDNTRYHLIFGDLRDPSSMDPWPENLDAAYFLIHSMGDVVQNLLNTEEEITRSFIQRLEKTSCQQIISLGGIIEDETTLSPHLASRLAVEKILKSGKIPVTVLRASIIIGAGSASFEIIRDLVEKLPFMIAPRWVHSYCQPIAVIDVIFYLTAVLLNGKTFHRTFDIGGPEAMTFLEVLKHYASYRKLRRFILTVPVLTPRLSSYWLVFVTSVKFSICFYLVESMKQNTRKINCAIDPIVPHTCLTFEESLQRSFDRMAQNQVFSTWMDAWDIKKIDADIQQFVEVPEEGCLQDKRMIPITIPFKEVERRVWSIGGKQGWYSMNWAWWLRGLIDQFVGGTGLNRGRRHPTEIEIGDSIDFWRVLVADKEKGRLVLYAEMKLPGEAWLEFNIDKASRTLIQKATFRPKGLLGRFYWYLMIPFHGIIFKNMAKALCQKID